MHRGFLQKLLNKAIGKG